MNEILQEWSFWWTVFCLEQGWNPDTVTKIVVISLIVLVLLIIGLIVFCRMRRKKAEAELREDTVLDFPTSEEDSGYSPEGDEGTDSVVNMDFSDDPFAPEQSAPVSPQPQAAPIAPAPEQEPISAFGADIPAPQNNNRHLFDEEPTVVADDLKKLVLRCWRTNNDYVDSAVTVSQLKKFREGILLGRGEGCHLLFACKTVSRRHAVIRERNGAFYVMDVGSSCGTQINGKPLEKTTPYPLKDGDQLYLGLSGKGVKISVLVKNI